MQSAGAGAERDIPAVAPAGQGLGTIPHARAAMNAFLAIE